MDTTPPPPTPAVARLGQSIQIGELDGDKRLRHDPHPWSLASIEVGSLQTMTADPVIPNFSPDNGMYLFLTVHITPIDGPFDISMDHFKLIAANGTNYDVDQDVYHHLYSDGPPTPTPGLTQPRTMLLMYDVPKNITSGGATIVTNLFKDQNATWTLP